MRAWQLLRPGFVLPAVVLVLVAATAGIAGAVHRSDAADGPGQPLQQWWFLHVVSKAQVRVSGGNAITLVSARRERDRALCRLLRPSRRVEGWLGTLHHVSTDGQQGEIKVALDDGVMLHTSESARLRPGSAPFEKVADLHDGDQVWFSGSFVAPGDGTCIRSINLFAKKAVTSPDFVFEFHTVEAAR